MMKQAKNPKWANPEKTIIDLTVTHAEYGEIPFTASPEDTEQHGRDLFARAVAGEFGPVAEYDGPSAETIAKQKRKQEIIARLAAIDAASVRPLRAVADGTATDFDRQKLAALEAEAATLRAELQGLGV